MNASPQKERVTCVCFAPGYECVAASRVEWVDVTAGVVKHPVPEVFGELEGDFPLSECHLFTVPHIHLTTEVEHQHLQRAQKKSAQKKHARVSHFCLFVGGSCRYRTLTVQCAL